MILADSGFWVALLSERDEHHGAAVEALRACRDEILVTTWPVLTETSYLLGPKASAEKQQLLFKRICSGACTLYEFPASALDRMAALMQKYRELPMDLADASLVVLAEDLDEGRILSTDQRDFGAYRWKNTKPFQNLLLGE